MIRRIYIDNYKCLVNFELSFDELTLLIGPNGVGKSAVLDVIFALRQLLSGAGRVLDQGVFSASTRTRWQDVPIQILEVDVAIDDDEFKYRLEIEHDQSSRKARILRELLTSRGKPLFRFEMGEVQLYRDDHGEGPRFPSDWAESALARVAPRSDNKRLTAFLSFMQKIVVCGLYPRSFATDSLIEEPLLSRDGSNFSAWYRHFTQEHQDLVPHYVKIIQDIIDGFRGIRLERVGTDARALMVVFGEKKTKYELRLDELSDGQRALLALYALVHLTAGQGYTLFLDEPDNYLALAEIQPWVVALNDACGDTIPQAVICSHHPELIDYLGGDRGLILNREVTGVTTVKKIADVALVDAMKLSEVIARGWER